MTTRLTNKGKMNKAEDMIRWRFKTIEGIVLRIGRDMEPSAGALNAKALNRVRQAQTAIEKELLRVTGGVEDWEAGLNPAPEDKEFRFRVVYKDGRLADDLIIKEDAIRHEILGRVPDSGYNYYDDQVMADLTFNTGITYNGEGLYFYSFDEETELETTFRVWKPGEPCCHFERFKILITPYPGEAE